MIWCDKSLSGAMAWRARCKQSIVLGKVLDGKYGVQKLLSRLVMDHENIQHQSDAASVWWTRELWTQSCKRKTSVSAVWFWKCQLSALKANASDTLWNLMLETPKSVAKKFQIHISRALFLQLLAFLISVVAVLSCSLSRVLPYPSIDNSHSANSLSDSVSKGKHMKPSRFHTISPPAKRGTSIHSSQPMTLKHCDTSLSMWMCGQATLIDH